MPTSVPSPGDPHCHLVLVRHGESTANALGVFTGWRDVELTARGRQQAAAAGRLLRASGVAFAAAFTSVLQRALTTADVLLAELGQASVPRRPDWRLNERHGGAMQGKDKTAIKRAFGSELARVYRRSWDTAPPPVQAGSSDDPRGDPRYRDIEGELPLTESMGDLAARVLPVWDGAIRPLLANGNNVLVVGHAMALRALARPVEGLNGPGMPPWKLASAAPRWYRLDAQLQPLSIEVLDADTDTPDE